jgi:hypothetical protein
VISTVIATSLDERLRITQLRAGPIHIRVNGSAVWYNTRTRAEAAIARWKQVIGDGLRSRKDERRATEMDVGGYALNRMLELGRPISVRIA